MMDSNTKSLLLAGAALTGLLGVTETVEAQDLGIGGGVTLGTPIGTADLPGPLVGVEVAYWLDDNLALDFYGNIGVMVPDGGDARFDLGIAAGILYAIAQGDDTKLELGVRAGVIGVINSTFIPGANDEDADLFLDVLLRVEHWFDNYFAMNAQVGASFRGDPDANPGFGMYIGAQAGIGLMYYFDGNARPGDGAPSAPEPEPVRTTTSTVPASPPPSSGGSEPLPDPESGSAGW
jgi:hypothetical protein